jgi:transposase
MLGLFGFRQVPLDLNRTLNFKIQEFKREERGERKLIYKGTLTGDPVKDEDLIVKQFIFANEQRLETFNKMRRIYDSVKVLGMRDKEIAKEFGERGAAGLYTFIRKNRFKPFTISDNMVYVYAQLAKEKGIPNVLTKKVQKRINRIIKKLYKQRLNQPFKIDVKDYVSEAVTETETKTAQALPQTPAPKVGTIPPQINQQTGLTRTEAALLSPSEQQIARTT